MKLLIMKVRSWILQLGLTSKLCVTLTSLQWMELFACVLNSSIISIISLSFTACCRTKVRLHNVHMLNTVQANCAAMNFYFAMVALVVAALKISCLILLFSYANCLHRFCYRFELWYLLLKNIDNYDFLPKSEQKYVSSLFL